MWGQQRNSVEIRGHNSQARNRTNEHYSGTNQGVSQRGGNISNTTVPINMTPNYQSSPRHLQSQPFYQRSHLGNTVGGSRYPPGYQELNNNRTMSYQVGGPRYPGPHNVSQNMNHQLAGARYPIPQEATTSQYNASLKMNHQVAVTSYPEPKEVAVIRKDPSPRRREQGCNMRVLTGRVGKVREWLGLSLPFPVLYVVHGQLVNQMTKTKGGQVADRNWFVLAEQGDGQRLRCYYQVIDRDLETFAAGEQVVVVGRGQGEGVLQVFSVERGKGEEDRMHLPRMENFAVRGIRLGLNQNKNI